MRTLIKLAVFAAGVGSLVPSPPARAGSDDDFIGPLPGARIVLSDGSISIVQPESRIRRGLANLPRKRPTPPPEQAREMERRRRQPPEDGPDDVRTVVRPAPEASGKALGIQEEFAAIFARADPRPPERTAHFDWLPHYDGHLVRHVGWHGAIKRVEPQGDGSWLATIHVSPLLDCRSFKTMVWDHVEETYRVKGDAIELVASDAATPKPHLQGFPAHP